MPNCCCLFLLSGNDESKEDMTSAQEKARVYTENLRTDGARFSHVDEIVGKTAPKDLQEMLSILHDERNIILLCAYSSPAAVEFRVGQLYPAGGACNYEILADTNGGLYTTFRNQLVAAWKGNLYVCCVVCVVHISLIHDHH